MSYIEEVSIANQVKKMEKESLWKEIALCGIKRSYTQAMDLNSPSSFGNADKMVTNLTPNGIQKKKVVGNMMDEKNSFQESLRFEDSCREHNC